MKKTLLMLLCACMLIGVLSICASAADRNYGKTYSAPYATPILDGEIDSVWNLAAWQDINVGHTDAHASVRFKVMHDATKIYFLAEITDAYVNTRNGENVQMQIHSHTCSDPDTCTDFKTMQVNSDGKLWYRLTSTSVGVDAAKEVFRLTKRQIGENQVTIMEWVYTPDNAIPANSTTPFGLEMIMDDYDAADKWIPNQTWNGYSWNDIANNAGNFGSLYFMTLAETEALGGSFFYNDVPLTNEAYEAILYTSEKGLFVPASATNPSFYPDKKLTRAQFVTILGRLADVNTALYTSPTFSDVNFARDAWFAPYAEWAREAGIVVGTQFMANKEISVSEAVVMMQRYAENIKGNYIATSIALDGYSDHAGVPAWAEDAMKWAVAYNIYPSSGTTLSPAKTMTRAMAAMLVYNYDLLTADVGLEENPNIIYKEPPAEYGDAYWRSQVAINALEFGFVGDGVTPNDGIMAYYIKHYANDIPLEFPNGIYAFEYSIDFPERIYLELAPKAELKCIADKNNPLEYFISLQKHRSYLVDGKEQWGSFDDYSLQSYIRGGTINCNYRVNTAMILHGGLHTYFENFMIRNVLKRGVQTTFGIEGVTFANGCYSFSNVYFYNDGSYNNGKAPTGTTAIYDNIADCSYYKCTAVNFEVFIETKAGMFTQCSGWFNSYGSDCIPKSIYAIVRNGHQSIFYNPLVDTYRYGFKMINGSSTSIHDLVWITNANFYNADLRAKYPMYIFDMNEHWYTSSAQITVNGMDLWNHDSNFHFSTHELPKSVFLNVRAAYGNAANTMKNFRNDTNKLLELLGY